MRSLDREFYDDFEIFLRTDREMKPKTVHEHLYRLKKNDQSGLSVRVHSGATLTGSCTRNCPSARAAI